jgi:energy-coupling factor transport system substrate-specific component
MATGGPKPQSEKPPGVVGPEIVGVWPAAVWIVVGTLVFLAHPDHFAGWKGGLYYVLGTGVVALVGGLIGLSARRMVDGIQDRLLTEVRHRRDWTSWWVALSLRGLLGLLEAVGVTLLALAALDVLE